MIFVRVSERNDAGINMPRFDPPLGPLPKRGGEETVDHTSPRIAQLQNARVGLRLLPSG